MISVYLSLLLICGIFSEGIGILSKEEPSNLHIRQKRVINLSPSLNTPLHIDDAKHMANLLSNGFHTCGSSILAAALLLTAAHCTHNAAEYSVLTGSPYVNNGTHHDVILVIPHPEYRQPSKANDLALLIIDPPIDFNSSPNWPITIYNQLYVVPNWWGTLTGWGCNRIFRQEMIFPSQLRSITVPIISEEMCHTYYNNIEFSNKEFCTYDIARQRGSCFGDSGGGFVLNGELAGVMSWSETYLDDLKPDVYISLANLGYRNWIIETKRNIKRIVRQAREQREYARNYGNA